MKITDFTQDFSAEASALAAACYEEERSSVPVLPELCEAFCEACTEGGERCFAAWYRGEMCAYLKISDTGETLITENPAYRHITGAYCLREHRGEGGYQNLLNYVIKILKEEGYVWLGVDYESINPAADGFGRKYFSAYTYGVVRRIDERIV